MYIKKKLEYEWWWFLDTVPINYRLVLQKYPWILFFVGYPKNCYLSSKILIKRSLNWTIVIGKTIINFNIHGNGCHVKSKDRTGPLPWNYLWSPWALSDHQDRVTKTSEGQNGKRKRPGLLEAIDFCNGNFFPHSSYTIIFSTFPYRNRSNWKEKNGKVIELLHSQKTIPQCLQH